jgi:hypothetical protein
VIDSERAAEAERSGVAEREAEAVALGVDFEDVVEEAVAEIVVGVGIADALEEAEAVDEGVAADERVAVDVPREGEAVLEPVTLGTGLDRHAPALEAAGRGEGEAARGCEPVAMAHVKP